MDNLPRKTVSSDRGWRVDRRLREVHHWMRDERTAVRRPSRRRYPRRLVQYAAVCLDVRCHLRPLVLYRRASGLLPAVRTTYQTMMALSRSALGLVIVEGTPYSEGSPALHTSACPCRAIRSSRLICWLPIVRRDGGA